MRTVAETQAHRFEREPSNRMFQSGSEAAGVIGTHWLYQGIDPDQPFD